MTIKRGERKLVHSPVRAAANETELTKMCGQPLVHPQHRPMFSKYNLGGYPYPVTYTQQPCVWNLVLIL